MSTPQTSTNPGPVSTLAGAARTLGSGILDTLRLAKEATAGSSVPGLEGTIGTVLALAEMVQSMKSNKEALAELQPYLEDLNKIDTSDCSNDLKDRLEAFQMKVIPIIADCKSLQSKGKVARFWKSKEYKENIQDLRDRVAGHIRDFTFYGSISVEILVGNLLAQVTQIAPQVQETNQNVKQVQRTMDDAKSKEILAKIKYVSARYNGENTPNICLPGTREEIINYLVTGCSNASQHIIMLSGSAGSGKSTIAKTVATILAEKKILAASFFFSREYKERREIRGLPKTLAYQLADFSVDFKNLVVKFLDEDHSGILDAAPEVQFEKLVVDLLYQIPACETPWIICLDALDECGQDQGQMFLQWLSDNIHKLPRHVRFFLTGRPNVPSYLKHGTLVSAMHHVVLDDIDKKVVQRDIQLYVKKTLLRSHWAAQQQWTARAGEIERITDLADGLFVFAATCVRYIQDKAPRWGAQAAMESLLTGVRHKSLDELYYNIVHQAIPKPDDEDTYESRFYTDSKKVLGAILSVFEPIEIPTLASLLKLQDQTVRRVLEPLNSVIKIPDGATGQIKIIHLSFRDYITSRIVKDRSDMCYEPQIQHQEIAVLILQNMQKELQFNICNLPTSHLANVDMPDFDVLVKHISGLLSYGCRFWAEHVTAIQFNFGIEQMVEELLHEKILFWLEVMSILGVTTGAISGLAKFKAWAKGQRIVEFVEDARKFTTIFYPAISCSAPHIYLTALALAPVQSEIKLRFTRQFPSLLSAQKGQRVNWPAILSRLVGHTDQVWSVAFSPDGKHIVSGSSEKTLRIWDAESGAAVGKPLEGHTDWVQSVAFVSGSDDKTLTIYNAQSITASNNNSDQSNFHSTSLFWTLHEAGWVLCNSNLLFWLPVHHRNGFWMPLNTLVIGQEQTLLSYQNFKHGTEWAKCYSPPNNSWSKK